MSSYNTRYVRQMRQERKDKGICIHCGHNPATPSRISCEVCREAMRVRVKGYKSKRPPKPRLCPLCMDSKHTKFVWHHWNRTNPLLGMWLCQHCNHIVELEDRNLTTRYKLLKSAIGGVIPE